MDDVPYFGSYAMKGRTYRYAEKTPLYPFGYGLSYTKFAYRDIAVSGARARTGETVTVSATVENVGQCESDEVVQLYVKDLEASCAVPLHDLRGFARVRLGPGEMHTVSFDLTPRDLTLVNDAGKRVLEPGRFRAFIGGSQPDPRSAELLGHSPLSIDFEIVG
jgi:beta-glucosidase